MFEKQEPTSVFYDPKTCKVDYNSIRMREHLLTKRHAALLPRQDRDDVEEPWESNRRYGVVIDAGSSGSRVYIYSWKDHEHIKSIQTPEELRGTIPIVERGDSLGLKWTRREEPGKSSLQKRI